MNSETKTIIKAAIITIGISVPIDYFVFNSRFLQIILTTSAVYGSLLYLSSKIKTKGDSDE